MRLSSARRLAVLARIAALAPGCGSIGPRSISGDPFDDNRAFAAGPPTASGGARWAERPTITIDAGG